MEVFDFLRSIGYTLQGIDGHTIEVTRPKTGGVITAYRTGKKLKNTLTSLNNYSTQYPASSESYSFYYDTSDEVIQCLRLLSTNFYIGKITNNRANIYKKEGPKNSKTAIGHAYTTSGTTSLMTIAEVMALGLRLKKKMGIQITDIDLGDQASVGLLESNMCLSFDSYLNQTM